MDNQSKQPVPEGSTEAKLGARSKEPSKPKKPKQELEGAAVRQTDSQYLGARRKTFRSTDRRHEFANNSGRAEDLGASSLSLLKPDGLKASKKLQKSKSCSQNSDSMSSQGKTSFRGMRKQMSEGNQKPDLDFRQQGKPEDRHHRRLSAQTNLQQRDGGRLRSIHNARSVDDGQSAGQSRGSETLLHQSLSLDERKPRIQRQKQTFGGTFDHSDVVHPTPTITLRRPSETYQPEDLFRPPATEDWSSRLYHRPETGSGSEQLRCYDCNSGAGVLNVISCNVDGNWFCNQDSLGLNYSSWNSTSNLLPNNLSYLTSTAEETPASRLNGTPGSGLQSRTSSRRNSASSRTSSPGDRSPRSSASRSPRRGKGGERHTLQRTPGSSPGRSPNPGSSPGKSSGSSPGRSPIHGSTLHSASPGRYSFGGRSSNHGSSPSRSPSLGASSSHGSYLRSPLSESSPGRSSSNLGLYPTQQTRCSESQAQTSMLRKGGLVTSLSPGVAAEYRPSDIFLITDTRASDTITDTSNAMADAALTGYIHHSCNTSDRSFDACGCIQLSRQDTSIQDSGLESTSSHGRIVYTEPDVVKPSRDPPDPGAARSCFCGYYTEENVATGGAVKKTGRCKFCRSRAKYLPGQRSLDTMSSKLFRRKRGTEAFSRRAVSDDRYSESEAQEANNTPVSVEAPVSTPSTSSRPHPFRRQARLEAEDDGQLRMNDDLDSTRFGGHHQKPERQKPPDSLDLCSTYETSFPNDIRGYQHIPGAAPPSPAVPRFPHGLCVPLPLPRQRSTPYNTCTSPNRLAPVRGVLDRSNTAPPAPERGDDVYPSSPPPAYDDLVKYPPPTYDEATNNQGERRKGLIDGSRSLPARVGLNRGDAEDIPDIYWEQAARELDFCTCRKCQARYRQYFELDDPLTPESNSGFAEAILPVETQIMMQELLTDGMAFCALM